MSKLFMNNAANDLTIRFSQANISTRWPPNILLEVIFVADYRKLYHKAFNALTDAVQLVSQAGRMMRAAQQECEEMFVEAEDAPVKLADHMPEEPKE